VDRVRLQSWPRPRRDQPVDRAARCRGRAGRADVGARDRQSPDVDPRRHRASSSPRRATAATSNLWRLVIAQGRAVGEPVPLTTGAGHEVTPTVAADGAVIYAAVTPTGERTVESRLEERRADGTIHVLTGGPADASPALSPDGATIAFARPVIHEGVRPRSCGGWRAVASSPRRSSRRRCADRGERTGVVAATAGSCSRPP